MYRYHYRLRVILLSLGVVFGYGSAVAHLMRHHGHFGHHGYGYGEPCADWSWSSDGSTAPAPKAAPAPKSAPAPKDVQ